MDRINLCNRQCLIFDVCPIDGTVVHIHHNFFAQQLLALIPQNRIAIHSQATILGSKDQRIANALHIRTIETHLMKSTSFAMYRIRIEVKSIELKRIGMDEQTIALREINRHSLIRSKCITLQLIIMAIITRQHVLANGIHKLHIVISLPYSFVSVVEQAIASQVLSSISQHRTVQQLRLSLLRIVIAQFGIDMIFLTINIRRTNNIGNLSSRIITQSVRCQHKLRIHQLDFVIEHRLLSFRTIFTPIGSKDILLIH